MERVGISPPMPPCDAVFIIEYLMACGPVENGAMDRVPIGWQTIDAWARRAGIDLPPWQAELLRRLSAAFLTESRDAEAWGHPSPWDSPELKAAQRAVVFAKLDRM